MMFLNEWTGFNLVPWQWVAVCFYGAFVGLSKTGIAGITTVMIPVMAIIFDARESTGIVLPMLCFADLLATFYYRRSADLKCILRLLPWAVSGFALALLVDHLVPARGFRFLIGISILCGVIIMLWNEFQANKTKKKDINKEIDDSVPRKDIPFFRILKQAFFGVAGGFSTMIGNAAGPIMTVYLLSMRLPKMSFVGTKALFYLILNYIKLPLQIFAWNNITFSGLRLGALMIPFILIGAALGIFLVKKIPELFYRYFVLTMTIVTTFLLFIR